MLYAVASGNIAAESKAALTSPKAKSRYAKSPARGRNATAASVASEMFRKPDTYRVAAHASTMKKRDHVRDDATRNDIPFGERVLLLSDSFFHN
jgi:hypothetical protein